MTVGVHQGYVMSPSLFSILIDVITESAREKGTFEIDGLKKKGRLKVKWKTIVSKIVEVGLNKKRCFILEEIEIRSMVNCKKFFENTINLAILSVVEIKTGLKFFFFSLSFYLQILNV